MKGEKWGYLTCAMHFAPNTISGYNVCPLATPGCSASCLYISGIGRMFKTQAARVNRTRRYFEDRDGFMRDLVAELEALARRSVRLDLKPAARLNATSDIRWEHVPCIRNATSHSSVMAAFPEIVFYDYTKIANRRRLPSNYHLTFSRSEDNEEAVEEAFASGMNVAVVFEKLPPTWRGRRVVAGDQHDLRFLDPPGVVVGLTAKERAKGDFSGFVVRSE
jgi:hypothetical protein